MSLLPFQFFWRGLYISHINIKHNGVHSEDNLQHFFSVFSNQDSLPVILYHKGRCKYFREYFRHRMSYLCAKHFQSYNTKKTECRKYPEMIYLKVQTVQFNDEVFNVRMPTYSMTNGILWPSLHCIHGIASFQKGIMVEIMKDFLNAFSSAQRFECFRWSISGVQFGSSSVSLANNTPVRIGKSNTIASLVD